MSNFWGFCWGQDFGPWFFCEVAKFSDLMFTLGHMSFYSYILALTIEAKFEVYKAQATLHFDLSATLSSGVWLFL